MEPIPKSGLYYPNKLARITILALEEVMGKNGINAILNVANLSHLIGNYPPDNLNREFDFADYSSINGALEELYGPRGGRGLAKRAGRAAFAEGLRNFGALSGAGDLAFKVLPLSAKLKIGLPALAKVFTTFSDQYSTVEEFSTYYTYTMHKCPVCWGRKVEAPCCHVGAGVIEAGLKWLSGGNEFHVIQTDCRAMGHEKCIYKIDKEPKT